MSTAITLLPAASRAYPSGLRPRCRPYGPNVFDDCLDDEYRWWKQFLAAGGLKACCPQGRKQYTSPPWVSMPSEGRRFRPITYTPLTSFQTAGVFNGVDTIVLQMRVPLGYDGVISDVVMNFTGSGFAEGSGNIIWRLAADYLPAAGVATGGRYLRDMGNIKTSLGSLTQPQPVPRGGLRVYSYDYVTMYCAIAPGATVANGMILASISGWVWPR